MDADAGTLDIHMSNAAHCIYWEDTDEILDETIEDSAACEALSGTWFNGEVGGFQLDLAGIVLAGASGGSAAGNGFMMSASGTTVIGFSLMGGTIPPGEAVLCTLSFIDYAGGEICLPYVQSGNVSDITPVISDASGVAIPVTVGYCYCSPDNPADECGVCGGTGIPDGACDCAGNVEDCVGECGGSAVTGTICNTITITYTASI